MQSSLLPGGMTALLWHTRVPQELGTSEEEVIKVLGNGKMMIEEGDRLIGACNRRNVAAGAAKSASRLSETWGGKKNAEVQHFFFPLGFKKLQININIPEKSTGLASIFGRL